MAVREAALKIRLERGGPGLHQPGAVLLLRTQKEVHSPAVNRVGGGHAGFVQRVKRFAGGIGIACQIAGLAPSAVRALRGDEVFHTVLGRLLRSPADAKQLHRPILGGTRGCLLEPIRGTRDAFLEFGFASGQQVQLQHANPFRHVRETTVFKRWPNHAVIRPVALFSLHRGDVEYQ